MSEQKVIMVTGGHGMVGRAIESVIKESKPDNEKWIFLSYKDGNLLNPDETKALFEKHQPTHVIHLAAMVGGLFSNMTYKCDFYRNNLMINYNVYENARLFKVKKLVSCLSTCIYPDKITYPIDETMLHNGPPHPTNVGFAHAKRLLDVANRVYNDQYGCNFTSVMFTNVFGPYDSFSIKDGHVLGALIHKVYEAKKNNTDLVLWGTGKNLRQFTYSVDIAKLVVWAFRNYDEIDPILFTVDEKDEVPIKHAAELIAKAYDFKGKIVCDTTKPDGQFKKTASNARMRKYLPDYEFTPLDQAITETVKWFETNYDIAKK